MDFFTLTLVVSILSLLRGTPYLLADYMPVTFTMGFVRIHKALKMVGGTWWFLIGAPIIALLIGIFLIPPPYNITSSTLPNLWVIIGNPGAVPQSILIFLGLWALLSFGFGATTAFKYSGKKRKLLK